MLECGRDLKIFIHIGLGMLLTEKIRKNKIIYLYRKKCLKNIFLRPLASPFMTIQIWYNFRLPFGFPSIREKMLNIEAILSKWKRNNQMEVGFPLNNSSKQAENTLG